jgi:signal transduction histidine kinase
MPQFCRPLKRPGGLAVSLKKAGQLAGRRNWPGLRLCLYLAILSVVANAGEASGGRLSPPAFSIADFQNSVSGQGYAIESFKIQGVVRAVVPNRKLMALQDSSAAVLLELPAWDSTIRPGKWVVVQGTNCLLFRDRFSIRFGPALMVDNDGTHFPALKSGSVFAKAGFEPIVVEWFNADGGYALNLEYEGPGITRQKIPDAALWQNPVAGGNRAGRQSGLAYAAYNGIGWTQLPDFEQLDPVATGVATNFDLSYRARSANTALVFKGYLQIPQTGVYTFFLESDDGSRLSFGEPSATCTVVPSPPQPIPATENLGQALANGDSHGWVEAEGDVSFLGGDHRSLAIELLEKDATVPVTVVEGAGLFSTNLLHRHLRVKGICDFSRGPLERKLAGILVPGPEQVEIGSPAQESARNYSADDLLTTVAQVRRLNPDQARDGIPAKIRGVVIAADRDSLVIQDLSGGVFVHFTVGDSFNQPAVGQLWEVAGRTDPGDFSPVIFANTAKFLGNAALPEPIQPTWDQLMNGSLDAEYVELHGVLTAISTNGLTILTPDGKVTVTGDEYRPLPQLPPTNPGGSSLLGSILRIRGCFTPAVNWQTRQVVAGRFHLYPAVAEVEEPAIPDPFSLHATKAADLLRFNARASALQITKVAGQVIYARSDEYFMLDGQTGVRILTDEPFPVQAGDLIEAVGYPKLGGFAPVLQDANIQKNRRVPFPEPVRVSAEDLLDRNHDSTWIQVEALLVSDTIHQDERVLELQSGAQHFMAILKSDPQMWTLFSPGSRLQLTGVYASESQDNAGGGLYPFELLLNNATGITMLQAPSWWTVRHAVILAASFAGALALAFVWITLLRRKVEERTAQLRQEIEERQRVEQHRVMEQERTRVAQDLHDELGVGLTQVGILGSLAKNPSLSTERKNLYLDQLSEAARTLVTGLDEIVWAVNPQYDSVSSLASYYALFAQRFLNLAGIACRFDVVEHLLEHPLDSRLRHGIFLAFKEALNNVVRHSGATEVRLKIEVARNQLLISVTDNGRGFECADGMPGNDGIAGMRERMEKLGGRCAIVSHAGRGTTIELSLLLGKDGS